MRVALISLGSVALTACIVANAFFQKQQFYPSVVYITKSSPSMAVLYIQAFVAVVLVGKMLRKVFFGQLRAAEMEHLIERFWYAVTETCLAFTVFRDDFSTKFVALFTLLLFIKAFHWLAEDRIDYMERSPAISWKFHIRALSLLICLGLADAMLVHHALRKTMESGASVQLVFGFEYSILLTIVIATFMKYSLHTIDLQRENPWENKTVYLLYTELVTGFFKVSLYIVFLAIMIKIHTFPLFAIRPMYLALRSFNKSLSDVVLSRRAISYMNSVYPDATEEELRQTDNVCIICREEMTSGKKLPCSHIFHTHCLRSWFQRQQSCPTCRMDVLSPVAQQQQQQQTQQQAQQQQQAQPGPQQGAQPAEFAPHMNGFPGMPPMPQFPMWPPSFTPPPAQGEASQQMPPPFIPPAMMPQSMFGMPPPPPMPAFMSQNFDLGKLTDEQLRNMEGQERQNVEARITVLRNIHSLLDTAILQLNQYSNVITQLSYLQQTPLASENTNSSNTQDKGGRVLGSSLSTESKQDTSVASGTTSDQSNPEVHQRRKEQNENDIKQENK